MDGHNLARAYRDHLSDFPAWEQKDYAKEWVLLAENMGVHLSIDETSIGGYVYAILSRKWVIGTGSVDPALTDWKRFRKEKFHLALEGETSFAEKKRKGYAGVAEKGCASAAEKVEKSFRREGEKKRKSENFP